MNNIEKFSEQIILEMIQEIERKSMSQVKGRDVDEVLKIFDESGITYEQGNAKCGDLSATQEDFIPEKVESIKKQIQETDWVTHPLFVSKEGKILDGHHRWLAYRELYGDDHTIPVTKVDLPLEQALATFDDSASQVGEGRYNDAYLATPKKIVNEAAQGKTIAVFPGRFQPYHAGHDFSREAMKKKFGDVYVATSDKVEPGKSPFNFSEKKQTMKKMFGIPSNKIISVKNPYNADTYTKIGDPTKDVLVIGLGEKDAQRLGSKWYKPYKGNEKNLKPFGEQMYTYIVPQLQMKVGGKTINGTTIREVFKKGTDKAKQNLFKKLYGKFDQGVFDLIVNKLNESVILGSTVIEDFVIEVNIKQLLLEVSQAVESEVDDGPATFYKRPEAFVLGQLVNKQKSVSDVIKQLGWQVVDWLAGDAEDIMTLRHKYKMDHVGDVAFGDVGVRNTTYPNPLQKYKDHMEKIATNVGYAVVDWLLAKGEKNYIDDPANEMASHEPLVQNTSDASGPLGEVIFSKDWWTKNIMTDKQPLKDIKYSDDPLDNRILLQCGGAYGHLNHPFDDMDLTFGDLKTMIDTALEGKLEMTQEKCLDGNSIVYLENSGKKTIKEVVENKIKDKILSYNEKTNLIEYKEILNYIDNGYTDKWLEIELENGNKLKLTPNHRVYVNGLGYIKTKDLTDNMELIVK